MEKTLTVGVWELQIEFWRGAGLWACRRDEEGFLLGLGPPVFLLRRF